MGWPQWIVLLILLLSFTVNAVKHGHEKPASRYDVMDATVAVLVWLVLLQWGGFFG